MRVIAVRLRGIRAGSALGALGQGGGPADSAEGQPSGVGVTAGTWQPAQPLRVRRGFIRARFHATGQGLGEHERGGGLECAAEQIGGAGRLEAQGPPILAARADLGEFHLAPRLAAQPRGAGRDRLAG